VKNSHVNDIAYRSYSSCVLIVAVLLAHLNGSVPLFGQRHVLQFAGGQVGPKNNFANAVEWPFVSWVDVRLKHVTLSDRGVSVANVKSAVDRATWANLEELRHLIVTSDNGITVVPRTFEVL
jgi:hypothetical protein